MELPAILGGTPTFSTGPPAWPLADAEVEAILNRAYADGSWGKYHGPYEEQLEQTLRDLMGLEHVISCASGTFAVELGLRALQVSPGDEVLLAGYDFPGNFLSIHAVGAFPVLVDVDLNNWNLSLESLRESAGPKSRAVIASHLHGGVIPMRELTAWAQDQKIAVLEDACQCPGAMVQGRIAGSWGDVGVLSFGGSKLLSAGRGGAFVTPRANLFQRAHLYQMRGNLVAPLSELQAAVLLPQLAKLAARNQTRRQNVAHLAGALDGFPGLRIFHNALDQSEPGYYKLGFQLDEEKFGLPRHLLVKALQAEGIAADEGFVPATASRSPRRYRQGSPLTETHKTRTGVLILHHPVLLQEAEAMERIAAALQKIHAFRDKLIL